MPSIDTPAVHRHRSCLQDRCSVAINSTGTRLPPVKITKTPATIPDKSSPSSRSTMMDVASRAGVSQATVSLVLNGSPGVKLADSTRLRVREAARELDYKLPSRTQRKNSEINPAILFAVDEAASDPWMTMAFDGAQKKATEFGYNVFLAVTSDNANSEAEAIEQFSDQNLAGIIYGTILTRRVEPSSAVQRHRTVLLNCYDSERKFHSVIPGDLLGGRAATQRLIDAGRKRIGFINGQHGVDASRDRLKGYRQALASNDVPYDAALVKPGNWEPLSGYKLTKELLSMETPPDAIFCANDMMAYGCYDALREVGLSIPEDISVIGFDDRELAKSMHPGLTTLILPHFAMGETAAEVLIEMIGGHNVKPQQIKVECSLVERSSV
jgi:LacI family transcriptional regulator